MKIETFLRMALIFLGGLVLSLYCAALAAVFDPKHFITYVITIFIGGLFIGGYLWACIYDKYIENKSNKDIFVIRFLVTLDMFFVATQVVLSAFWIPLLLGIVEEFLGNAHIAPPQFLPGTNVSLISPGVFFGISITLLILLITSWTLLWRLSRAGRLLYLIVTFISIIVANLSYFIVEIGALSIIGSFSHIISGAIILFSYLNKNLFPTKIHAEQDAAANP